MFASLDDEQNPKHNHANSRSQLKVPRLSVQFRVCSKSPLLLELSEWLNSGLTSHQQRDHTKTGPGFKVSSERPEKRGIDLKSLDW